MHIMENGTFVKIDQPSVQQQPGSNTQMAPVPSGSSSINIWNIIIFILICIAAGMLIWNFVKRD